MPDRANTPGARQARSEALLTEIRDNRLGFFAIRIYGAIENLPRGSVRILDLREQPPREGFLFTHGDRVRAHFKKNGGKPPMTFDITAETAEHLFMDHDTLALIAENFEGRGQIQTQRRPTISPEVVRMFQTLLQPAPETARPDQKNSTVEFAGSEKALFDELVRLFKKAGVSVNMNQDLAYCACSTTELRLITQLIKAALHSEEQYGVRCEGRLFYGYRTRTIVRRALEHSANAHITMALEDSDRAASVTPDGPCALRIPADSGAQEFFIFSQSKANSVF